MVPFTAKQLISVRSFELFNCFLSESALVFSRATIWSGTVRDDLEQIGTIAKQKGNQSSSGPKITPSYVDHGSTSRDVQSTTSSPARLTGIVCELGSPSKDVSTLTAMIENGMTIAKINCSKVSQEYYDELLDNLHVAAADYRRRLGMSLPIAVALETGLAIRTEAGPIECTIEQGGVLKCGKPVSDTIQNQLKWGITHNIDMVFTSCTETALGVQAIREIIGNDGHKSVKILAKIENLEGWKNFHDILEAADGIVLDREELSKCIPPEKVFSVQKAIISRCNTVGKPVITSGQILSSMLTAPQPLISDCADISTMVLDGVDCIELTEGTSEGKYPKESVACLSSLCRVAETSILHSQIFHELSGKVQGKLDARHAAAISAVKAAIKSQAKSIVCITKSGKTAYLLAMYSPPCPVVVVTRDPQIARECLLFRPILPILYEGIPESDWRLDLEGNVRYAIKYGMTFKFFKNHDTIIIMSEEKQTPGFTDCVRVTVETVDRYIDTNNRAITDHMEESMLVEIK